MSDDITLLRQYGAQLEAELARIGIGEADQRWILAGASGPGSREQWEAFLSRLHELPDGFGPESFCRWLGFDYASAKEEMNRLVGDVGDG